LKKPQWITVIVASAAIIFLYAFTSGQIFGKHLKKAPDAASTETSGLTIDSILHHAKERLSTDQVSRLNFLESSISRGDVTNQKIHIYHQLSRFWGDSAKVFEPYAWYTAESARLESSEKSLTFAAHLFLNNLQTEENPALKQWKALQAKDLFERSLRINPANDSSAVGLGAAILFGGLGTPMEGIQKIRKVVEEHPENFYAQMTLGRASLMSGQLDKAVERFKKAVQLQPENLEAILSLADVYERMENKTQAISWYKKSLPLINIPGLREEVEKRISDLGEK
jgi:tetratricopeptide (TPR) repeat protein